MKKILSVLVAFSPVMVFAQARTGALNQINNVNDLTQRLLNLGDVIIYVMVSIAVIFIVYHVVRYLVAGADPAEKTGHLKNVGWGILGLAIIVSIWGLVNILVNSFSTNPTRQPIPNVGSNVQTGGQPANQIPVVQ